MKKILILCLLLFAFGTMFAQKPSIAIKQKKNFALPKSLFNLDFNYCRDLYDIDYNIGIISIKTMIGSNNTGIIIGVKPFAIYDGDLLKNNFGIQLGYQKRILKGLFTSLSLELTRIKFTEYYSSYYNSSLEKIKILPSLITSIGYTFSFGRAKKIYLNTEMVYSVFDRSKTIEGNLSLMAGLGFRFGTPAKTTLDNVTKTLRGVRIMP